MRVFSQPFRHQSDSQPAAVAAKMMQSKNMRRRNRKARAAKNMVTARAILEPPLYAMNPTTKRMSKITPVTKMRSPIERKRVQSLLPVKLSGTGHPSRSASSQMPTAMKIILAMPVRTSMTRSAVRPCLIFARYALDSPPW